MILNPEQKENIKRQIEQARSLEFHLTNKKKPFMKEYRIVARINRNLSKLRKERRKLEKYISEGVEE